MSYIFKLLCEEGFLAKKKEKGFKKWGPLAVLCLAMFIVVIDTTIMNVSIGAIVEDIGTTVQGVQGAIALYALVMAALILPGGKLGDIWGKKRTFLIGLVIFTIGTLTASYAPNLAVLIIGWSILEGIGGALMIPQIQGLIRVGYEGKDRAKAYGILGGIIASGAAFGPIVGGWITENWGWFWSFRIEAVIAVIVFALSFVIADEKIKKKIKMDITSVFQNAFGMVLIILGLLMSTTYGLIHPRKPFMWGDVEVAPFGISIVTYMILAGLLLIYLTYRRAQTLEKAKKPLLYKASLLKNVQLTSGLATLVFQSLIQMGIFFGMSVFLQQALNLNSIETGVALLPMSLSILVVSFLAPGLGKKFFPKHIIGVGFLMMAFGILLMDVVIQRGMTQTELIPGFLVFGIGIGLLVSQVQNLVLSSSGKSDSAELSGLNGTAQQFGNSLGTAMIGTFVIIGLIFGFSNAIDQEGIYDPQSRELLATTIQKDAEKYSDQELEALLATVPLEVREQIEDFKINAEFNSIKSALGMMAVVAVIGYLVSLKIPKKKLV